MLLGAICLNCAGWGSCGELFGRVLRVKPRDELSPDMVSRRQRNNSNICGTKGASAP
jgi:hypothetical protein